jgi:hypothetical protein
VLAEWKQARVGESRPLHKTRVAARVTFGRSTIDRERRDDEFARPGVGENAPGCTSQRKGLQGFTAERGAQPAARERGPVAPVRCRHLACAPLVSALSVSLVNRWHPSKLDQTGRRP